ncbi:MAG: FHA domain-containing protein [Candidatus Krumholzibacteriia bacterium]
MTTVCSACTHENRHRAFFCSQCGTRLHFPAASPGRLVRMNGTQQDKKLEIPTSVCILGRAPTADVVFEEESVSKQHARLSHADGEYRIEDLGSSNGTFVNGRRVREATEVHSGDLLRLGSVILKLEA